MYLLISFILVQNLLVKFSEPTAKYIFYRLREEHNIPCQELIILLC